MQLGSFKKLNEDEIQDRLAVYASRPDPKVRDEIVLQYGNLVESVGRRFLGACESLEDLTQEGYIGLIRSVDKYDVNMGVKFSTYATHFIIGEIKHYLRDKGKIIKEPAWLQELNQRMTRVIDSLGQKLNRQPTEKEIADVMEMSEKAVREMLTTREVFKVSSLDCDKDDAGPKDSEKIQDQKVVSFQLPLEDKIVLETALARLKDIEQHVIDAHYYKGLNQTEIAKIMGISCNYVSHILRNGTKKLKKILQTEEIRDTQMQHTLVSQRVAHGAQSTSNSGVLDGVTGTYNRQYFIERLDEEISRAYRAGHKLAVLLVQVVLPEEMDRYARMIRTDDALYSVAGSVRKSVRKMDVLARYGAMCFGLILPHTGRHAMAVAERLEGIVASVAIESGRKGMPFNPSAKIGIARYPTDAMTGRDLLQTAADSLGVSLEDLSDEDRTQVKRAA